MPISVSEAVDEAGALARTKAEQARNLPRYALASLLAGAYVGVAVVLLISVGAPLVSAASPYSKLVQGAVFGVALTLVVFAGAELFTGNTMTMLQGLFRRDVRIGDLAVVWVSSLAGNFVGSLAFAAAVHQSGALTIGATPAEASPAQALLGSIVEGKDAAGGGQLSGGRCCATPSCAWDCGWRHAPAATPPNASCCGGHCSRSSPRGSSTRSPT